MGTLNYGSGIQEFTVNDRVLAHLQIVITDKLRRHESFVLSWNEPRDNGSGRVSLWISPHIPIAFTYTGPFPPLNRQWLRILADAANTPTGLFPLPEPETSSPTSDT